MGFTAPAPTDEQREAKRLAQIKAAYGVCRRGGHVQSPDNTLQYEGVPYCRLCVQAGAVTPTTLRWVYFVADGAGHVKIGHTLDVAARVRELQTCNAFELVVLSVLRGGSETEHALHQRFAEHRVRGEWFRLAPEIVEFIAQQQEVAT